MNSVDVAVEGGDELDQLFQQLPVEMRRTIMPKAVKAAATIVQEDAKNRINSNRDGRKPPGLARTIVVKVRQYDYTITAVVGPVYLGVNHGHLVEFGHRLVKAIRDADGSVRKVEIGFVPAHPFLRPAADQTLSKQRDAIVQIVTEMLKEFTT
jgi:HK97 gp10 family phage protein